MDAFSYLSVLLSIILGLAIAQVLQGYRALLLARGRIHCDPAPLSGAALSCSSPHRHGGRASTLTRAATGTLLDFAAILLQMGLLYMLSALILPDVPAEQPVDLSRHFERHRKAFFIFLLAMLASSIVKEAVLEHRLPSPLNLSFHVLLALIAVGGILFRNSKAQLVIAVLATLGFLTYVALLFARL